MTEKETRGVLKTIGLAFFGIAFGALYLTTAVAVHTGLAVKGYLRKVVDRG